MQTIVPMGSVHHMTLVLNFHTAEREKLDVCRVSVFQFPAGGRAPEMAIYVTASAEPRWIPLGDLIDWWVGA